MLDPALRGPSRAAACATELSMNAPGSRHGSCPRYVIPFRTAGTRTRIRVPVPPEQLAIAFRRTASSRDPGEERRLLQSEPDTFIPDERRPRASDCAAAEPGQGGRGAPGQWSASRIPAAGGVSRSDE